MFILEFFRNAWGTNCPRKLHRQPHLVVWRWISCSMRRSLTLLAAVAIAAILVVGLVEVVPVAGQEGTRFANAPTGLRLFSSDGKQLGKVIGEGADDDDQPVIVAEIERPRGADSYLAAIPTDLFVQWPDRVVVKISANEVAKRLLDRAPNPKH
jgi:hypothetical protein